MNNIYIYNNSFISLLNLIRKLISDNIVPTNIKDESYNASLFDNVIRLEISNNENIIDEVLGRIGKNIFKIIYYVFLSKDENKELIIYYFYLNSLKYKKEIVYMRNLKCVNKALSISQYVSRENHKYKGFVRFKELKNNVLYAEIEPENDILYILSNHFKNRLKNEYWIIKDNKRDILSIYDKNDYYLVMQEEFVLLTNELSDREKEIEDMWKSFYKTIGIKERKNDRCRNNFMPKKYWKYIIEMSEEIENSSK